LTARPLVGYPIATEEIRCGLSNRMPTLELAYSEAETIALEAAALGRLTPEQAQVLRTFFADLEKNALSVYQAGRMVASHTYDRTEIANSGKANAIGSLLNCKFWTHSKPSSLKSALSLI
jgi:hypothetical protein